MRKDLGSEKLNDVGAITSLVLIQLFFIRFQSKFNFSFLSWLSIWCNNSIRSFPLREKDYTPMTLKLFNISLSILSSLGLASLILSASIPKVIYFVFINPLFPFDN